MQFRVTTELEDFYAPTHMVDSNKFKWLSGMENKDYDIQSIYFKAQIIVEKLY